MFYFQILILGSIEANDDYLTFGNKTHPQTKFKDHKAGDSLIDVMLAPESNKSNNTMRNNTCIEIIMRKTLMYYLLVWGNYSP